MDTQNFVTLPREVVEQALTHIPATMLKETHLVREALRAALTEQVQPAQGERAVSAEVLSKMFHAMAGIDKNQDGYFWCTGWNAALRQAMDYAQPAALLQSNAERVPLSEAEARKLCFAGPVYAPDGLVTRRPNEYRKEIEDAMVLGLRKGEAARGITKGQQ